MYTCYFFFNICCTECIKFLGIKKANARNAVCRYGWIIKINFNLSFVICCCNFCTNALKSVCAKVYSTDLCPVTGINLIQYHRWTIVRLHYCAVITQWFHTGTLRSCCCINISYTSILIGVWIEVFKLFCALVRRLNIDSLFIHVNINLVDMKVTILLAVTIQRIAQRCWVIEDVVVSLKILHMMMVVICLTIQFTWVIKNCSKEIMSNSLVICIFGLPYFIREERDVHRIGRNICCNLYCTYIGCIFLYIPVCTIRIDIFAVNLVDLSVFKEAECVQNLWHTIRWYFSGTLFEFQFTYTSGLNVFFFIISTAKVYISVAFVIRKNCRVKAPFYAAASLRLGSK